MKFTSETGQLYAATKSEQKSQAAAMASLVVDKDVISFGAASTRAPEVAMTVPVAELLAVIG